MQRQRGFPRGFRAVNFDHAAARQPADAKRDVKPERAGGDGIHVHRLHIFAEPHDRALAEVALDLRERGIKGLRFVHGRSFDETKRCTHVPCSLWPGFGRPTTHANGPRITPIAPFMGNGEGSNVHHLFLVRNMFFWGGGVLAGFRANFRFSRVAVLIKNWVTFWACIVTFSAIRQTEPMRIQEALAELEALGLHYSIDPDQGVWIETRSRVFLFDTSAFSKTKARRFNYWFRWYRSQKSRKFQL